MLDASLGGIRIYSDDKHEVNSSLELDLFLKDGTSLRCDARVAWAKQLPKGADAVYEVGLAFTDIAPDALELLKTVLLPEELVPEEEGSPDSP